MTFAIEMYVGPLRGHWLRTTARSHYEDADQHPKSPRRIRPREDKVRFATREEAEAAIALAQAQERRADLTPIRRRAVAI